MNHIPRLSEAVYVGLCRKIGGPSDVKIRREVMDTNAVVKKSVDIMKGFDRMMSGSKREGFRLKTSDEDWMFWSLEDKVICDLSQISLYRIPQHTVILMEYEDLPPGFTRLELMSASNKELIRSSCLVINNGFYVSSTLFRNSHLQLTKTTFNAATSCFPHGPCTTVQVRDKEIDNAYCFRSHHWPIPSLPWIKRCRQQGWSSDIVLSNILSGGFHVVPIGSTPEKGEEWRISFSQAEQKLIYSMNHCQFLCYGLLKIFLNEVINFQNSIPALCSYFMKTVVFWVIQRNHSLTWTPDTLLSCFWECFKYLIYWVYVGECPNFFIPQNNMFQRKVIGSVQTSLFCQLYDLYCKGISCLLFSQTVRPYLSKAILNRTLGVCTDASSIISCTELDITAFDELNESTAIIRCMEEFAIYKKQIERLIEGSLTPYQEVTLQCITSDILRNTAMLIQNTIYPNKNRKVYYKANKIPVLLKLSCILGYLSDTLYLGMHFYRTCRYEHSLSCLYKVQKEMFLPYTICNRPVNVDMYERCMVGMSLGSKIRKTRVTKIAMNSKYTYIDELVLEQKITEKNGEVLLFIPALVILHMLFILNHHRLGDTVKLQESLRDLQTQLLCDDGTYVSPNLRGISWQILGICQQICGDSLGSFQSYQHSLQQEQYQNIQEATLYRINTLFDEHL